MLKKLIFAVVLSPLLAVGLAVPTAAAADFSDPDWPCIQRKVPNLSVGQMWAGPPITDADLTVWRKNADAAAIAPALAVRRTSDDEAGRLISDLAARLSDEKDRTLSLLFAGTFALIERERSQIIAGISRYSRTQISLSKAIETQQNRLSDLKEIENPDFDTQDEIEELEDKLLWDTRIFKERQQSLTHVCETPVILERRAFSMARAIMEKLD